MGALTSPSKSGVSGGGQRVGQGHVGEGSVRPTRCELPPLLGVTLQPLRPSGLGTNRLGRGPLGVGREGAPVDPSAPHMHPRPSPQVKHATLLPPAYTGVRVNARLGGGAEKGSSLSPHPEDLCPS